MEYEKVLKGPGLKIDRYWWELTATALETEMKKMEAETYHLFGSVPDSI